MNQTSSRWLREFITSSEPRSMPQMRPRAHTAYHLIKARGCSSQEHKGWLSKVSAAEVGVGRAGGGQS